MQHGKCCYCESILPEKRTESEVEHYRPKSKPRFRGLKNDWKNLLLACRPCNSAKWDHFPEDDDGNPLIIDPSDCQDNPEEHFSYVIGADEPGALLGRIEPLDVSRKGKVTIEKINLNEDTLRKQRADKIGEFISLVYKAKIGPTAAKKRSALNSLQACAKNDSEFAGLARYVARKNGINMDV